ncbi:DUF4303 domain-containing protein [Limnobaculum zhutongyuii]|nr:DUF4303 domain-containing protein [Limnobaculum zhutongyuii]
MDWKAFKSSLFESAKVKIEALLSEGVAPLYAAAFFASYREQEGIISLPSLAANNLAMLNEEYPNRKQKDEGFYSIKWNPADWHWNWEPEDYGEGRLTNYETQLETYSNRGSVAMWNKAEERFVTTVVQVAVALNKHFAKDPRVLKDFVVFFYDEEGGAELARKCMSARQFLHHFPEQDATEKERRRVATLPLAEQTTYYVGRLGYYEDINCEEAEQWLIACGAPAIPALLELFADDDRAWKIAMILGLIGEPNVETIAKLRELLLLTRNKSTANWCASALGYLGDFDWLLAQSEMSKALEFIVVGCCANFRAFRDRGAKSLHLDYSPLEKLFQLHPESITLAEDVLKPGSSYCEIVAAEIPEALRGLLSPHPVIRRHAVSVLDNRMLGESLGIDVIKPIQVEVTILAKNDKDETVRYLAELTLKSMKKWRL